MSARRLIASAAGADRLDAAIAWLHARPRDAQVLVVAATLEIGQQLLAAAAQRGGSSFGWHSESLGSLAGKLAALPLARHALSPVGAFALEALCARAVFELRARGELGRFERVAERPGLPRALARTLGELAMAGVAPDAAELDPDLARLYAQYRALLAQGALADRARMFAEAAAAARESALPPVGLPLLLWDVRVAARVERELVAALCARAPECLATAPVLDARSLRDLEHALDVRAEAPAEDAAAHEDGTLRRLQRQLFAVPERGGALGDDVVVLSAPGEARECVEIARRILREAERGVPFDRMAILLRAPELYRVHLCEALRRARVPAHFARGSVRPEPAGRALLALLACAAENFSARRFAEYLSLGVLPMPDASGAPPPPLDRALSFVPPDDELLAPAAAGEDGALDAELDVDGAAQVAGAGTHAALEGTVPAPRHWERLLCEAAVLGGKARWQRRLDGLQHELERKRRHAADEDPARSEAYARELGALAALRAFALPLIDTLAALPRRASWREWLDALSALATRALARPAPVLQGLSELAPMAEVADVGLGEVRLVLERRFGEQRLRPAASLEGKVFVAPIEEARGLVFDVVFVPGLAEKIFPPKLAEDPLLLDAARAKLRAELPQKGERVGDERCALSLALGAARERLVVSYPRFAVDRARPRVPSFYALEVLRAAEGELPGWAELQRRATEAADARMGWPAPRDARDAIDDAEYDLVVLDRFLREAREAEWSGAAHYLLHANAHLGRALRFRARRWHRAWHAADGLVQPSDGARAVLARHALSERAYSATGLERFAACPYRFYLGTILGLSAREQPEPIETLAGAERGALVHEVLRVFLHGLRADGLLPLSSERRDQALDRLDEALKATAERHREQLAPAIERVWQDGVVEIRADLRDLVLRAIAEPDWAPAHFELSFGLRWGDCDPESRQEPVQLDCGIALRGAIDLVERHGQELRAVDYKTGAAPEATYVAIAGGRMLQPLLYAQALQKLFPEAQVRSGQAYYCTARGGFRRVELALDARAGERAALVSGAISSALEQGFFPAAPEQGACERCDYAAVCGPYEEQRAANKNKKALERLIALRREP